MNQYQTKSDELAEAEVRLREKSLQAVSPLCVAEETKSHFIFLLYAPGYGRGETSAQVMGNEVLVSAWKYPSDEGEFPRRHYEIFQASFTLRNEVENARIVCALGAREGEYLFLVEKANQSTPILSSSPSTHDLW